MPYAAEGERERTTRRYGGSFACQAQQLARRGPPARGRKQKRSGHADDGRLLGEPGFPNRSFTRERQTVGATDPVWPTGSGFGAERAPELIDSTAATE